MNNSNFSAGMGSTLLAGASDRSRDNTNMLGKTYLINETQQSCNDKYLNMTIELLQLLEPSKKKKRTEQRGDADDDYDSQHFNLKDIDKAAEAEDETNIINLEYPSSFTHLIKILLRTNERKLLGLSNPDGFFYLYYLKTCIKLFFFITVLGSVTISFFCYASYK